MYRFLFRETGRPTSNVKLWLKQLGLGKKFPKSYRKFLKETGGGTLTFDHNWLVQENLVDPVSVELLYGSGKIESRSLGVFRKSWAFRFTYGMPSGTFAIGEGESGEHELILMGRSAKYGPKGAIFSWDSEMRDAPIQIANSFDDFVAHLTTDPDGNNTEASFQEYCRQADLERIETIDTGELSPDLASMLGMSRVPDLEVLIRNGLRHAIEVSERPAAINGQTAPELLFLLVYLATEVRRVTSCPDFLGDRWAQVEPERPTNYPQFHTMITPTFAPLQSSDPALQRWWEKAVDNWEIFEYEGAFFVGKSTIEESIEKLRDPEKLSQAKNQEELNHRSSFRWKEKFASVQEMWFNSRFMR